MSANPYKQKVGLRFSRVEPYVTLACGFLTVLFFIAVGIALGSDERITFEHLGRVSIAALIFGSVPALFFAFSLAPLFARHKGRILLLRRFGQSKDGRFDLPHHIRALTAAGWEVVTLKDSDAPYDKSVETVSAAIYALLMAVFFLVLLPSVPIGAAAGLYFLVNIISERFFSGSLEWLAVMMIFLPMLAVPILFSFIDLKNIFSNFLDLLFKPLKYMVNNNSVNYNAQYLTTRLRRPWTTGLIVLETDYEIWEEAVCELLKMSDIILVDLRNPSKHCQREFALIRQLDIARKTIWLDVDGSVAIQVNSDSYLIHEQRFSGSPHFCQLRSTDTAWDVIRDLYPRICHVAENNRS